MTSIYIFAKIWTNRKTKEALVKLKKWPKTETEYWMAIEELGGFSWRMNHDLADGRIEDPKGAIDKEIQEAVEIQKKLVAKLKEKFGVIPPDECPQKEIDKELPPAPEGKIYYWNWYHKMKEQAYREEYQGIICSACPFSKGVEYMISMGGHIPCGLIQGSIYRLHAPYACGMLNFGDMSEEDLHKAIQKKGEKALRLFLAKRDALKKTYKASRVPAR